MSDGLIAPVNAPPAGVVSPGVQPGVSQSVVIANRVIVYGTNGGIYVYSGTPAAGSLIASITGSGGLDPYKLNNCVAGIASYFSNGTGYLAIQLVGFAVQWQSNTTFAGAYTVFATFNASLSNNAFNFLTLPVQSTAGTAAAPTLITTDDWNDLELPSSGTWSGTVRYALLPLGVDGANFAVLDVNVTFTTTTSAAGYNCATDMGSDYYPAAARQYPLSVNQNYTTETENATPRVAISTAGVVTLDMPAFGTAGNSCIVSGTVIYPLN